jgi:hypothetical protein
MVNPYLNAPRIFQDYQLPEDEEDQGILSYLGDVGLGALGTLGNILDTPGSFIRGIASGNFGRAFGGIFDPSQRVSGKELAGVDDNPDSWGDDIAGIGTEILFDPLTYLTLGASALGKGGKIAKAAGTLPETVRAGSKLVQGAAELGSSKTLRDIAMGSTDDLAKIRTAAQQSKPGWIQSVTSKVTGERFGDDLLKAVDEGLNLPVGQGGFVDEPLRAGVGRLSWGERGINLGGVEAAKSLDNFADTFRYGNWLGWVPESWGQTKPQDYGNANILKTELDGAPDISQLGSPAVVPPATVTPPPTDAVYNPTSWRWDVNPVRDYLAPAFQKSSRGFRDAVGQITSQNATAKELEYQAATRGPLGDLIREWEAMPTEVQTSIPLQDLLSDFVEKGGTNAGPQLPLIAPGAGGNILEIPMDFAQRYADLMGPYSELIEKDAGTALRTLKGDELGYMARQAQNLGESADEYTNRMNRYGAIGSGNASQNAREEILRGALTTDLSRMTLDPNLVSKDLTQIYPPDPAAYQKYLQDFKGAGTADSAQTFALKQARQQAADFLLDNYDYQGFDRQQYDALVQLAQNPATADAVKDSLAKMEQARSNAGRLVDWLQTDVGDKYLQRFQETGEPLGFFTNNPMEMLGQRLSRAGKSAANAKAKIEALPQHLIKGQPGTNSDLMSLADAAEALGMATGNKPTEGFLKNIGELVGDVGDAKNWSVPRDVVENLARLTETIKTPQEISAFWNAIDKSTTFFKTFALMRPAFHVRNLAGGQIQNAQNGLFSVFGLKGSRELMNGDTIAGLAKRMGFQGTDEEATKFVADLAFQHDVIPRYAGQAADLIGVQNNQVLGAIPGSVPANASFDPRVAIKSLYARGKEAWKNRKGGTMNPLNSRGLRGEESKFFLSQANEQASHIVEGMNRLTAWIEGLSKGIDPATLAQQIKDMHVDYGNLSQFERSVMRRAMPFWSFSRGMVPYTVKQLAQNPGGPLGKTLRTITELQGEGQILPEHIAQTAAIPYGTNDQGDPRYITGLGLMPEDSMTLLGSLAGSLVGRPGLGAEFTGMLNPLIKAPLETATGRSLFQDRELRDMDPVIGRIKSNIFGGEPWQTQRLDTLAMNIAPTPLTTIKQLTDTRKGIGAKALNTLTGVKVTDVPAKTQEAMARGYLQDLLRETGGQAYEKVFISKEELAKLPPEKQQRAMQIQALLKELSERAKKRAKAAQPKA